MTKYRFRFITKLSVDATAEGDDEETAADAAWEKAQAYALTLVGDGRDVVAEADFDGVTEDEVVEL